MNEQYFTITNKDCSKVRKFKTYNGLLRHAKKNNLIHKDWTLKYTYTSNGKVLEDKFLNW